MDDRIKKEMLDRLQKGEQKAFESVFMAYYGKIKTFIRTLIKSDNDAEDLTQDIFARLWTNHRDIDPQKSFQSYMYTLARNAAFNFLKHKTVCDKYLVNHIHTDMDISPEDIMYAREIELLIEMSVSQMPGQQQKIYRMSRNDGLTNDEIAMQLGISKKTVENQLSLTIRELRKLIVAFSVFFV